MVIFMFDDNSILNVARILNINFSRFPYEDFKRGINIELEHGLVNPNTNVASPLFAITGCLLHFCAAQGRGTSVSASSSSGRPASSWGRHAVRTTKSSSARKISATASSRPLGYTSSTWGRSFSVSS